jgi:hypothetical protein
MTAAAASDAAQDADALIRLQFSGPTKPAVITGTKRDSATSAPDFRYLVVPQRALTGA